MFRAGIAGILAVLLGAAVPVACSKPAEEEQRLYRGEPLAAWLERLESQPGDRVRGEFERIGVDDEDALPLLALLMTSEQRGIAQAARVVLWRQGPAAVGGLARVLQQSESPRLRSGAALALGVYGSGAMPAADALLEALGEAVESGDDRLRRAAAHALAEIGPDALPILGRAFAGREELRAEVLGIVEPFGLASVPSLREWRLLADGGTRDAMLVLEWRAMEAIGSAAHDRALILAGRPPTPEAADAPPTAQQLAELGVLGAPEAVAVERLSAVLGQRSSLTRRQAARALVHHGRAAAPAAPALAEAAAGRDLHLRWAAAEALAAIGPEAQPGTPALTRMLEEENLESQQRAARALEAIGPAAAPAAPRLAVLLIDGAPRHGEPQDPWPVQCAAAKALAVVDPEGAPPLLVDALGSSDWRVRHAAAEALALCGRPATAALERALMASAPQVRRGAALAFLMSGESTGFAAEALARTASEDGDEIARWAAAETLARLDRQP